MDENHLYFKEVVWRPHAGGHLEFSRDYYTPNSYLSIVHRISLFKKDYPTTSEERKYMSRIPYASIVESIMYAMTCTTPDVAYSLGIASRYQSDAGENH